MTEGLLDDFTDSFEYYAPRCLKIQTMEGGLASFQLNTAQRLLEGIFADIRENGRFIRAIILKARREGVSTWTEGRFFWHTTSKFNRYAATITHEPEASDFLFKMTKRFYTYVPPEFKPETKYSNQKLLEFNRADGSGLDSAFRIGTAGKEDFGSGQLIHYLHLSEVAKWPKNTAKDLLTSVLQCVPDEADTEVVMESTARGIGGEFYSRYWSARYRYEIHLDESGEPTFKCVVNEKASRDNEYSAIFIPWFVFEYYQTEPAEGFKRTPTEKQLAELHNLSDSHLAWRRWAIENRCGGNEDVFKQEYPSNPKEAFLVSGVPIFNNEQVITLKENAPKPEQRYECQTATGQWIARDYGNLRVWQEPKPMRSYIIGADVAEGLAHGDFSVADVIDHLTGEQVAQWHGKVDPDEFGRILYHLGARYNNAWVGCERNNHGLTTITILNEMKYKRLYAEMIEEPPNRPRKRYGWLTTNATRPLVIDILVEEMRERSHGIKCEDTFDEMMSFKRQDNGKMEADSGMNDDRVLSMGIAKAVRRRVPLPSQRLQASSNSRKIGGVHSSRTRKPPVGAWT